MSNMPNTNKVCQEVGGYLYCDKCPLYSVCASDFGTTEEWENAMENAATEYISKREYYNECTPAYAVAVIKEVIEYTEDERTALELIRQFMDGELTVEEVEAIALH